MSFPGPAKCRFPPSPSPPPPCHSPWSAPSLFLFPLLRHDILQEAEAKENVKAGKVPAAAAATAATTAAINNVLEEEPKKEQAATHHRKHDEDDEV